MKSCKCRVRHFDSNTEWKLSYELAKNLQKYEKVSKVWVKNSSELELLTHSGNFCGEDYFGNEDNVMYSASR